MPCSIGFTDSTGTVLLVNGKPFSRFKDWTLIDDDVESAVDGLGTGDRHRWVFRTDYGADFRFTHIPGAAQGLIERLRAHLRAGGSVTVNTGDSEGNSYTAKAWPDWKPEPAELTDADMLEYTLHLRLRHTTAAPMRCVYRALAGYES